MTKRKESYQRENKKKEGKMERKNVMKEKQKRS